VSKDTNHTCTNDQPPLELPAVVSIAVAELASTRQGLLAAAVGTELLMLQAMLDEDVTPLVSAKGSHNQEQAAVRHGTEAWPGDAGRPAVGIRRPGWVLQTVAMGYHADLSGVRLHRSLPSGRGGQAVPPSQWVPASACPARRARAECR